MRQYFSFQFITGYWIIKVLSFNQLKKNTPLSNLFRPFQVPIDAAFYELKLVETRVPIDADFYDLKIERKKKNWWMHVSFTFQRAISMFY